ncbi:YncE family protein [Caldisalinibacter kiritimatiensis]|uniref:Surface antigen n=1 Tax=Caldisalinibacter kiritimatiensis TaxID=1304284 RepID=R1CB29_9FIRM|nr:YncE family protein [Caldisalinibacter kiritimatiensis]EOC99499.1 Surface antigen [Caldisalinibacter kiritimatiensis]
MCTCKGRLIVANMGDDSLSILDIKSLSVIDTISLGPMARNFKNKNLYINGTRIGPHCIVSDECNIVYSVNSYHNSLFKVNIENKEIEDIVYVGTCPSHVEINEDLIFVTNSDSNSVSIIDKNKFNLVANIPVSDKPHDIKLDKEDNKLYITNNEGDSLHVILLDDFQEKEIRLSSNPLHIIIKQHKLYILSSRINGISKSSITILNKESYKLINKLNIEGIVVDMIVMTNGKVLYATNAEDGYLYKININDNRVIGKYFLGGMPNVMLWDGRDLIYITNAYNNYLTVFDITKEEIVKNIKVGIEPAGMLIV